MGHADCDTYCCNPDNDQQGAWCYVESPDCQGESWGFCAGGGSAAPEPVNVSLLVVGKVTDQSANVLLELSGAHSVVARLCQEQALSPLLQLRGTGENRYIAKFAAPCARLAQGRPVVLQFEDLPPGARLPVELAPSLQYAHNATVRTQEAPGSSASSVSLGIVSCNKLSYTLEEVPEGEDMWEALAAKVRGGEIGGLLHIGDQVYVDNDRHKVESNSEGVHGRTKESVMHWCPYCQAEALLQGRNRSVWEDHADGIRESFRQQYRQTWGHPPTAYVLANTANLFITDDHELRDDMGDGPDDLEAGSMHVFLSTLAFEVAWEYQYALNGLGDPETPGNNTYHQWKFTDKVGIFFLDTRISRSIFHDSTTPQDERMLQARQWGDLRAALAAEGAMAQVEVLVVVSPVPLVYTSRQANNMLKNHIDDFEGSWANFAQEQNALLNLLDTWQAEMPGRKVVVASGDVHHGGHSAIYGRDGVKPIFTQLTASAVSNRGLTWVEELQRYMLQEYNEQLMDYSYEHRGWTRKRNFGVLEITTSNASDEPPVVVQSIYITDGAGGGEIYSSYTLETFGPRRWW